MGILVQSLHFYPIKSCAGVDLKSADISPRGITNDRGFLLVDENNRFISQRTEPKLALVKVAMGEGVFAVSSPEMAALTGEIDQDGPAENVEIWKDTCLALSQGQEIADWFSSFLGKSVRLMMMKDSYQRDVDPKFAISSEDNTGFADGFPFLLISQASLQDLNSRLEDPVPMNRFRPNIVVSGCEAYAEDSWRQIKIGSLVFDLVKPCSRCVITTINQDSLEKSKEPLRTLASYRTSSSGGVMFGQNMIHRSCGTIIVGDGVDQLV